MFIYLRKKIKAQSTAEYVMLIALAIAAINLVSNYMKKSVAGKIKWAMDEYNPGKVQFEGDKSIHKAGVGTENLAQKVGLQKDIKGDGGLWKVDESSDEAVRAGIVGSLDEVKAQVDAFSISDANSPWGARIGGMLGDEVPEKMDELTGEDGRQYTPFE